MNLSIGYVRPINGQASEYFNEEYQTSKRARPYREDSLEDVESERREIAKAEEKDSWVKREWVDVGPGEEVVDLRDLGPDSSWRTCVGS